VGSWECLRSLAQNEFTYFLLPTPSTAEEMWSASSDARFHATGLLLQRDQYAQKPLLTRLMAWEAKILVVDIRMYRCLVVI